MRSFKALAIPSLASLAAIASIADAQAITATGPTIAVTANAGATPVCTITAGTAPAALDLTSLTNTTVTLANAKGAVGSVILTCTGNGASMTVTATSSTGGATLTSVTGGNGYTVPFEIWSGTTAAAPNVKLTPSGAAFPFAPVAVTTAATSTLNYYVNVPAASKLTAVGTASTTSVPYGTALKANLVFSAVYN